MSFFTLSIIALVLIMAYNSLPLYSYVALLTIYFIYYNFSFVFIAIFLTIAAIFIFPKIRSKLITAQIILLLKKLNLLPKISETEKIALTSGSVWVDGQLFSGKPNFKWIFSQKYPKLSPEEQKFLDNEVEEVCKMCTDYEVQINKDLPTEVWQFLKDRKFFGMIIPKEYGGLGFSAMAHGCVIEKLASRSVPLAITAMVPNSLGPAELLLHYGTKEQRDYYLPRLADGRELPCFALTESNAGSDATSIVANGVLFRDENGEVKIKLNWSKRYITLGAVATIIGVAFQLRDPDKILSANEEIGITCALIPNNLPGVRQGRRHDPLATPFINSPINGENVIVGLDAVIGGKNGLGKGWKMLMECLAAGRGISLPSTSVGGSKFILRAISAYSMIRKQFNAPICKFEGVEEVLARMIARTYMVDALKNFTAGAIDSGSKPAVITAIAKYHATEIFRKNINDGMDIMGGRAIIRGPRNLLANAYFSTPISITVEGANIMTRSLMHFGQGAVMCHPYAIKEMEALENNDIEKFDIAFFLHIKHLFRNFSRSILLSLTRGYLDFLQFDYAKNRLLRKYLRKINWASATFALLADIAMARFGGDLKRKEKLNGRFGDVLSALYIATCVLKKFENNGYKKEEEFIVDYAMRELLGQAQTAIDGIYQNIFCGFGKYILLPFAFWSRFNAFACQASDWLGAKLVSTTLENQSLRHSLTKGIFISNDKDDNLGRLEYALKLNLQSFSVVDKIKSAVKNKTLPKKKIEDLIILANAKSIITNAEMQLMQEVALANFDAMQVDEYSIEEYLKI